MLREVPGFAPPPNNLIMSLTTEDHDSDFEPTTDNALDDIFGSAPNSPLQATTSAADEEEEDPEIDFGALEPLAALSNANSERSDIPRLRSTHVTAGYRDGIATSKAQFVQEGFDEGFSLGAVIGLKAGWLIGCLEGVVRAVNADKDLGDEVKGETRAEFVRAREELALMKVFGREWFGEDGIWKFEVEGEKDGEVTFREVAAAHPVLRMWEERVGAVTKKYGLEFKTRTGLEHDEEEEEVGAASEL